MNPYDDIPNMTIKELQGHYEILQTLSNDDIDLLIVHLQYIRVKRERDWKEENYKPYKFCDKCNMTYPSAYNDCTKCQSALRALPVWDKFSYLLDPHAKDENKYVEAENRLLEKYRV